MFGIEDRKLFIITRVLTIILSLGVIACGIIRIIVDTSELELISCNNFLFILNCTRGLDYLLDVKIIKCFLFIKIVSLV